MLKKYIDNKHRKELNEKRKSKLEAIIKGIRDTLNRLICDQDEIEVRIFSLYEI